MNRKEITAELYKFLAFVKKKKPLIGNNDATK